MLKGFKDFLMRGNLVELAVAFVMGVAFTALVQSLVADLFTPIIAAIFGEPDFGRLSFTINDSRFAYGSFLNAVFTFASVALAVYFFVVLPYERVQARRGITPESKTCPECLSEIPVAARRCSACAQPVT